MKTTRKSLRIAIILTTLLGSQVFAAPVTNKDIINLLEAGMGDDVVIQAIASGESKFDTSSGALIKLKQKGASPAVLKAMLTPKAKSGSSASGGQTTTGEKKAMVAGLNPEEVLLVADGQESTMQYIIPGNRMGARAFGFGGMASYAVLQGVSAQRRLPTSSPEFIISVPKNAQATNYLTLANFAVRNNNTREVLTGGGYMSYSSGIHRDRVISVATEQLADQSRARDGFILYRIKPEQALAAGEYALVLYTGEVRTAGFFSQVANSYFDFGVD